MSEYDIRHDFLSNEDAERQAAEFPELGADVGWPDYCPTCNKTGTYRWKGEDRVCDCQMQLQLHRHYLNSGVGVGWQRLGWDDWFGEEPPKAFAQDEYLAKNYADDGDGLLFWGEMGVGKTMLAHLIIKDLIKRGKRCYAITMEALIGKFTEGWESPEEKRWFDRKIRRSSVLLIDDLGKEKNRGSLPISTFNNLLRDRVHAGRATLITTNLDWDYLSEAYGASTFELLYESNIDIEFTGTSVRPLIRNRKTQEKSSEERRPIQ